MSLLSIRQRYSPCHVEVESQEQNQQLMDTTLDYVSTPFRALSASPLHCDASWRRKLESCLWIASAAFIVYYGDFRTNLVLLLATDNRIHRLWFNLGLMCFMLNTAIMLYVAYRLHNTEKPEDRLEIVAQGAVPAAAIIGVTAFSLFSYALWPIWSFLTIPMLFTLFMALVVVAPYLAPYMKVRLDVDALKGIYIRPTIVANLTPSPPQSLELLKLPPCNMTEYLTWKSTIISVEKLSWEFASSFVFKHIPVDHLSTEIWGNVGGNAGLVSDLQAAAVLIAAKLLPLSNSWCVVDYWVHCSVNKNRLVLSVKLLQQRAAQLESILLSMFLSSTMTTFLPRQAIC
ncbi:hypothetical protein GOP47_0014272 [Adiantum capillus-veneris]|uniref:Uncharacterized protein n=1 Tax=Adiantum capillus-veneris TaxID=13818 RepID=A0A9D4ULR2_ADICA|nr:hypothetical protein GOP47_0014272 [Adiantum capillus-veneris]